MKRNALKWMGALCVCSLLNISVSCVENELEPETGTDPGTGENVSPEPGTDPELPPAPDAPVRVWAEAVKMVQGTVYTQKVTEQNLIDGNYDTYYGAGHKEVSTPTILEFLLRPGAEKIDYLTFVQRKDHLCLDSGLIEFRSGEVAEWKKCGEFNGKLYFPTFNVPLSGVENPTHLRVTLNRGPENMLSLAEMECWSGRLAPETDLKADLALFEDDLQTQLKSGTTAGDIAGMEHPVLRQVAEHLLAGTYSSEFRVRTYKSCKDPTVIAHELSIGKRSVCDNSTGIFFEKGKEYSLSVSPSLQGHPLKLGIFDWREARESQVIVLKEGVNTFTPEISGTGYVQYWTPDDQPWPDVKIHFWMGNEIGFWDKRVHTNADWPRILKTAEKCAAELGIQNPLLDVSGDLVQIVQLVDGYRSCCPTDIESVVAMYDELMTVEYTVMGLVKNHAVPKNRILGVKSWSGSPNWNGTCANFPKKDPAIMLTRQQFEENIWLFGHEFGHGNQVAQMKGAGWTEVTNNIYSQHAMYRFCDGKCRLEHYEYKRDGATEKVMGDRFNLYLNETVVHHKDYLTYGGEYKADDKGVEQWSSDVFSTLAPLWQLSMFFMITEGTQWHRPDFWPDVIWAAMHDNDKNYTYGEMYCNFMKRVIIHSGYDMTSFLKNMGLLREMDIMVGDYGPAKKVTITRRMVEEVERLAKTMKPLPTEYVHYISANSLEAFAGQLPVEGTYGQGISENKFPTTTMKEFIVDHSVWKNMTVFEVYSGQDIVEVAMAGTGSYTNSTTLVRYPDNATRIEAVSWNGTRTLVYGKR